MRGLKIEKRWEPGMGYGVFAREPVYKGDLIMFDLPFMSLDINQIPEAIKNLLMEFETNKKVAEVLHQTVESVCFESKKSQEAVKDYILHKEIDIDLTWMTLLASWGVTYCNNLSPVNAIPFSYFSYIDDHYENDPLGQRILELGYENILDVTGIDSEKFTMEDFWISLFKVKSNVHNDALYPVAPTLVNHSCWPNATFAADGALVATVDIPSDTQVTIALYGSDCSSVESKGLAGKKFKCFTPGCQFSKRIPLPEPKNEEPKEILYRTPWHRMDLGGPVFLIDCKSEDLWESPAKAKYKQVRENEVTRSGIDRNSSPQLPGSRPRRLLIRETPGNSGQLLSVSPPQGPGEIHSKAPKPLLTGLL